MPGQLGHGRLLDPLLVEPQQLLRVEHAGGGADVLPVELLDQLLDRENLLVAVRPSQPRKVVHQRPGQITVVAILQHAHRAVALRQPLLVGAEDHRQVREGRNGIPERLVHEDLSGRIDDVVVAARDERDLHLDVVHHRAEVVERHSVGTQDHLVLQLLVLRGDLALHEIAEGRRAFVRHAEADHGAGRAFGQVFVAARSGIFERVLLLRRLLAQLVEELLAAVAPIGASVRDQRRRVLLVCREAVHLEVRCVRATDLRSLVPGEPEPPQPVEDRLLRLLRAALAIGVLDPQDERALLLPRP